MSVNDPGGRGPGAAERSQPRFALLICAIVLLALLSHFPLRHSEYVQDDHLAVERNTIVERGDVREIFSTTYWEGARGHDRSLYRPVVILSYALERKATGTPNALASQAINLLLHVLVSCALLLLANRMGATPFASAAAAILFALHPVHLEAVANIVGRAELLAALFSLLALWTLSHAGPWTGPRSPGRERLAAWSAAAFLFLALGSKEIALALPLLLVAFELLLRPAPGGRGRAWWRDRAAALAPSALAALIYLWMRTAALEMLVPVQRVHPLDNLIVNLDGVERLYTALGLLGRYIWLLCWPARLAADYSGPVISTESGLFAPLPLLGAATLLAVCASLLIHSLKPGRAAARVAFACLLFLLPYLVIGNLLFTVGTVFGERLIYLPSAGFCLLGGLLVARLRDTSSTTLRRLLYLLLALALLLLLYTMWVRSTEWRDDETVFRAAARVNPNSPRAHFILGKLALDRGDADEASESFERTIAHYPEHVSAWLELGNALALRQRYHEAERAYRRALEISPAYAGARLNLALALRHQRRLPEAELWLRKALLADESSAKAWAELGNLYLETGRYTQALDAYREAQRLGHTGLRERMLQAEAAAMDGQAGR